MTVEQQKKVLILGGTRHLINYVDAFNAAGIYTIVADDMPGASAKKHADLPFNHNPADVLSLAELVKAEGVTGVFADVSDITTWNAIALCKKADLPYYVINQEVQKDSAKVALREFCRIYSIKIEAQGEDSSSLQALPFPLTTYVKSGESVVSLVG
ncbi:MAG TPA: hypothetical protein VK947_09930 [Planococcus sp. (in: firmicutes)]|nr:hypothetical protein [Planococcus sp. (in: firmicutes)]